MSNFRKSVRQALTIARRDFIATVFARTFLIFLFTPLLMLSLSLVGSLGATNAAQDVQDKERNVVIAAPADAEAIRTADTRLQRLFRDKGRPDELAFQMPQADPAAQARAAFHASDMDVTAVLYGPLTHPTVLAAPRGRLDGNYLAELAEQAARIRAPGGSGPFATVTRERMGAPEKPTLGGQHQAAFFAVLGIFMLTLMLASQSVGTMAEERSNKVIEVLAAAVPLESVFFGKLIGMFGMAAVFITFWGTIIANIGHLVPGNIAAAFAGVGPAVGMPAFILLFFVYFFMAFMLLGAVFLSIGAQASTMREIQMLSLPITITQVAMFALSSAAASHPGTTLSLVAEILPFSSPFAMAARAANQPEIWPHVIAIAWQLFWVSLVITLGARAFRRGVLQSGTAKRKRKRGRDIDMSVSNV